MKKHSMPASSKSSTTASSKIPVQPPIERKPTALAVETLTLDAVAAEAAPADEAQPPEPASGKTKRTKSAPAVRSEKADKAAKADKAKKPKLVRDSFTIPKAEYGVLDDLKARAAKSGTPAKKSEVLRAAIKALAGLDDGAFLAALASVPAIKTGRPAKG